MFKSSSPKKTTDMAIQTETTSVNLNNSLETIHEEPETQEDNLQQEDPQDTQDDQDNDSDSDFSDEVQEPESNKNYFNLSFGWAPVNNETSDNFYMRLYSMVSKITSGAYIASQYTQFTATNLMTTMLASSAGETLFPIFVAKTAYDYTMKMM
jgi:hypothetical protein